MPHLFAVPRRQNAAPKPSPMPLPRLIALFLVLLAVGGGFYLWSSNAAPEPLQPLDANAAPAAPTVATGTAEPARAEDPVRSGADEALRTSAAPAGAPAPAAAAAMQVVVGRVVDEAAQPVAGAQVSSFAFDPGFDPAAEADRDRMRDFDPEALRQRLEQARRDAPTTTSGADGRFRLEVRSARRGVPLRVQSAGFVRFDRMMPAANAAANGPGNGGIAAAAATEVDAGDLVLRRGAIVRGRVLDAAGAGVAAAFVGIEPADAAPAADGQAARGNGNGGGGGGRAGRLLGGNGDSGNAGGPFGRGGFGGNFWRQLPGAERFAGLFGDEVSTAADGSFELLHVEPGTFTVRARHDEHPTVRVDDVAVVAGAARDDVVLTFGPSGAITGKLVGVPAGVRGLRVVAAPAAAANPAANGGTNAGPFPGIDFGEIQQMAQSFGFATERDVAPAADGTFALRGLRSGTNYRVYAVQRAAGVVGDAVCSDRRELGAPATDVELRFDAGVQVVFQVVAADSAAPIVSMAVDHRFRGGSGMEAWMAMLQQGRGRAREYPDGKVQLVGLRPRSGQKLEVVVEALGFKNHRVADLELPESGIVDLGVVKLTPGPVVRVHVVEGASGKPVVGANVSFAPVVDAAAGAGAGNMDPAAMAARVRDMMARGEGGFGGGGGGGLRTDADGRCVANAPEGSERFTVAVRHRDFAPANSAELRLAGATPIDVEFVLDNGGQVEIAVVDPDGKPVANARVDHRSGTERGDGRPDNRATDDNGVVVFDRLAAGEHRFKLAPRGGGGGPDFAAMAAQFAPTAADDASWQRASVTTGQRTMLRLQQERRVSVQGVVRQNGVPMAGVRVAFAEGSEDQGGDLRSMMADFGGGGGGRGRNARTGEDGAFELSNLPVGNHRLRITGGGRTMPMVVPVVLGFGANLVDIVLDSTSLAGRVLGPDGSPVADAQVSVSVVRASSGDDPLGGLEQMVPGGLEAMGGGRGGRGAKSDGDGQFVLPGVQAGPKLRLRATAKGFAAAGIEVDALTAGEQRTGVELRLSASGKAKVTVAGSSGPFQVLRARMLDAAGQPRSDVGPEMQMLRRGEATIDGLRPGSWRIELVAGLEGVKDSRVVEVAAGQTVDVSFCPQLRRDRVDPAAAGSGQ